MEHYKDQFTPWKPECIAGETVVTIKGFEYDCGASEYADLMRNVNGIIYELMESDDG